MDCNQIGLNQAFCNFVDFPGQYTRFYSNEYCLFCSDKVGRNMDKIYGSRVAAALNTKINGGTHQ